MGVSAHQSAVIVGREAELERIRLAVRAARAGRSGCLVFEGEAGVGKTRLQAQAIEESRRLGMSVLHGRASLIAQTPFGAVAEALRTCLRNRTDEFAVGAFAPGLRLILPEWPRAEGEPRDLSDGQLRLLALEGLVRLVRELATPEGVLFVLDDLHGCDPDSLEAFRYLATAAVERTLVLAGRRPEEGAVSAEVVQALRQDGVLETIRLEPLERARVADLLAALLDAGPPPALVERIYSDTDGVPLLVEEALAAHLRAESVKVDDEGVKFVETVRVVPATVSEMVTTRLDSLSEGERLALTAAAVTGDLTPELLSAVAGQPPDTVHAALTHALQTGLLQFVRGTLEFRHAILEAAVLEKTLPHVLRDLHARAAAALEESSAPDARLLERRARHLAGAGRNDDAASVLIEASEKSREQHALLHAEALAIAAEAHASSEKLRVAASDAHAAALAARGRWAEALELDERTTKRHGQTRERWLRMALSALDARRIDVARALVNDPGIELAGVPSHQLILGRIALLDGRGEAALELAGKVIGVADAAARPLERSAALDLEARALDYLGRREEAAVAYERNAELAARAGLTQSRLRALVWLAELELIVGRPPARLHEACDAAAAAGALVEQAWAELNLSIALVMQGRPRECLELTAVAVDRARELRLDLLPFLLASRAGAEALLGLPDFEVTLQEAVDLAGDTADMTMYRSGILGEISMQCGEYERAVEFLEQGVEAVRAAPGSLPSDSPQWLSIVLLALGRRQEAEAALEVARSMPQLDRWCGGRVARRGAEALLEGNAQRFDAMLATTQERQPFSLALLRVFAARIIGGPDTVRWLREALDIYEAHEGFIAIDQVRRLLREAGGAVPRRPKHPAPHLIPQGVTPREAETLQLVARGLSNSTIADKLHISIRTVESHVSALLAKLGVSSREQLSDKL